MSLRVTSHPPFAGFPEGSAHPTPLPDAFFTDLLPAIDHLGELKITLYAIRALAGKQGTFRCLSRDELVGDAGLVSTLGGPEALTEALGRAVARGSLLLVRVDDTRDVYFLNSPKGRAAIQAFERGEWRLPSSTGACRRSNSSAPDDLRAVRAEHRPAHPDDRRASPRGGGDRTRRPGSKKHWASPSTTTSASGATCAPSWTVGSPEAKMSERIEGSTETARRRYADTLDT